MDKWLSQRNHSCRAIYLVGNMEHGEYINCGILWKLHPQK